MRYLCFVVLWAGGILLVSGCGAGDSFGSQASPRSSPVLLQEPPPVCDSGGFSDAVKWHIGDDSSLVEMVHVETAVQATLDLSPEQQVLCVASWESTSGVPHLLVGTIDSSERFSLFAFHDADSDGLPDLSTQSLLFTQPSGEKAYITSVARSFDQSTVYLLDRRCQDIRQATDTNSDGLPDSLETQAFALSASIAGLVDVAQIVSGDPGHVSGALRTVFTPTKDLASSLLRYPRLSLEDTNADGVVDVATVVSNPPAPLVPGLDGAPFHGQTTVSVRGQAGETVECWLLDASGAFSSMLGSLTLPTSGWEPMTVAALFEGSVIALRFASQPPTVAVRRRVRGAWPQITSVSPYSIEESGGTFVVEGSYLSTTMLATLWTQGGTVSHQLTFTLQSGTVATLTVPTLDPDDVGSAAIMIKEPSQPATAGASVRRVAIVED